MLARAAAAIVILLIGCASHPNKRLVDAVGEGDEGDVRAAMRADGVDLNARVEVVSGWRVRPVVAAVTYERPSSLRLLLEAGADPNRADADEDLALLVAAEKQSDTMIELLLQHKADPRRVDAEGKNALVRLFQKAECAGIDDDLRVGRMAKALLVAGADPNARAKDGTVPLRVAVRRGCDSAVGDLLGHGASVAVNPGERPILIDAFHRGSIMSKLLAAGADPSAKDVDGRSACEVAKSLKGESARTALSYLSSAGDACAREAYAAIKARDPAVSSSRKSATPEPKSWEPAPPPPPVDYRVDVPDYGRGGTRSYENERSCKSGTTFCGKSCCGTGTMCCVPDGASNQAGGMCIAIRTGHGCPWGTHKE